VSWNGGLENYWFGGGPDDESDPLLPHVSDQQIRAIGDSYDDGRIDVLAESFIKLRKRIISAVKVLDLEEE
jgi:hypothetical protein